MNKLRILDNLFMSVYVRNNFEDNFYCFYKFSINKHGYVFTLFDSNYSAVTILVLKKQMSGVQIQTLRDHFYGVTLGFIDSLFFIIYHVSFLLHKEKYSRKTSFYYNYDKFYKSLESNDFKIYVKNNKIHEVKYVLGHSIINYKYEMDFELMLCKTKFNEQELVENLSPFIEFDGSGAFLYKI